MDAKTIVKKTMKTYRETYPERTLPDRARTIVKKLAEQMEYNFNDPDIGDDYSRRITQLDNYDAYQCIRDDLMNALEIRIYEATIPQTSWIGDRDADMIASLSVTIVKKTYDPCITVMANVIMEELGRF